MAKRKLKPEDLREACIEEALVIIGESGLEALSLREVARRLHVSHQAPYKHFLSRDHILAEVVSRAYQAFAVHLDSRPRSDDPREDLGNMGRAYLAYAQTHPLHYKLMFETQVPDPDQHPEMMRQAKHAFSLLKNAIALLPNRPGGGPPELDALFVWSVMHGLASILRSHALRTLDLSAEMIESVVPFALHRISIALGGDPAHLENVTLDSAPKR